MAPARLTTPRRFCRTNRTWGPHCQAIDGRLVYETFTRAMGLRCVYGGGCSKVAILLLLGLGLLSLGLGSR